MNLRSDCMPSLYRNVKNQSNTFYSPVFYRPANLQQTRNMELSDVVATRRARLRQVLNDRFDGKQTKFVEKTGINAGELSGLLRTRFFGEKKARTLEGQLGLPNGWLDGADENEAVVAEFAQAYRHATPKGREFLKIAIGAARAAYMQNISASVHLSIVKDEDADDTGA